MNEPIKKTNSSPESYSPKNKPEILSVMENMRDNLFPYPPKYRITPKNKIAEYTGESWPHSNAYPAMFSAISLFYGKESRLNDKGEQVNDDLQYHIQASLTTEAYGIQYSALFENSHLKDCLGLYGIKPQVINCLDWDEKQTRNFVCSAIADNKTIIIEPKEYKDMHFVFGYGDEGKTLFCCPFLDGDDHKNHSFNFSKYRKRKNRTANVKRLIVLEEVEKSLNSHEVYRQSLKCALKMMSNPSPQMDLMKLTGSGVAIYDTWISLLEQANVENSEVFYMHFPVFPQFIILFENRLHFCEFLKVCVKMYGEIPELMELIRKCEEVQRLVFEDSELGFHRENGNPKYLTVTYNERRKLLIGVLEKCRIIDKKIITLLKRVCEVL